MVLDHLSPTDVVSVQKDIGSYLGDAFWRARISTELFRELIEIYEECLD